MRFDYFYGKESDMMSFYRVPKLLITDPYFEDLDNEAKLMYGLMLDRMSLSAKNGWYDNQRRVYIIYGQKSLMKDLHRGRNKISDMLNALEKIGLIEREKTDVGSCCTVSDYFFWSVPYHICSRSCRNGFGGYR